MRLPIALGLAWPERLPRPTYGLDWTRSATWEFEPLDETAFPSVALCKAAGRRGGTAPAVLNAANEVCVEAFVAGDLPFLGIVDTVAAVVEAHPFRERATLAEVLESEQWARQRAAELVRAA
jgi:1-deoxy-D-xylulose-5-phosphate reductoisomerase